MGQAIQLKKTHKQQRRIHLYYIHTGNCYIYRRGYCLFIGLKLEFEKITKDILPMNNC